MGNTLGCLKKKKNKQAPIEDNQNEIEESTKRTLKRHIQPIIKNKLPEQQEISGSHTPLPTSRKHRAAKIIETGSMISPKAHQQLSHPFKGVVARQGQQDKGNEQIHVHELNNGVDGNKNAYLAHVMKFQSDIMVEIQHLRKALKESKQEIDTLKRDNEQLNYKLLRKQSKLSKISRISPPADNLKSCISLHSLIPPKFHPSQTMPLHIHRTMNISKEHEKSQPFSISEISSDSSHQSKGIKKNNSSNYSFIRKKSGEKHSLDMVKKNRIVIIDDKSPSLSINGKVLPYPQSQNETISLANDSDKKSAIQDILTEKVGPKKVMLSRYHPSRLEGKNDRTVSSNSEEKSKVSMIEKSALKKGKNKKKPRIVNEFIENKLKQESEKNKLNKSFKFIGMNHFGKKQNSFMSQRRILESPIKSLGAQELIRARTRSNLSTKNHKMRLDISPIHRQSNGKVLSKRKKGKVNVNILGQSPNSKTHLQRISSRVSYGFTPLSNKNQYGSFFQKNPQIENSKAVKNLPKFENTMNVCKKVSPEKNKGMQPSYSKFITVSKPQDSIKKQHVRTKESKQTISFVRPHDRSQPISQIPSDLNGTIQSGSDEESSYNEISKSFHQNAKMWKSMAGRSKRKSTLEKIPKDGSSSSNFSSSEDSDNFLKEMIVSSGLMPVIGRSKSRKTIAK